MKSWYKSFTLWFNVFLGSLPTLLSTLGDQLPSLQPYIPQDIYVWLFGIVTIGNVLIRVYLTKTAINIVPLLVK